MKPEYEIFQLNKEIDFNNIFSPDQKSYESILDDETKKLLFDGVLRLTSFDELYAVGVKINNIPHAIAIASTNKTLETSRIIVFFILDFLNEDSIGIDLMNRLLIVLKSKGCKNVDFIYLKEDINTPKLEILLNKCHFHHPELFIIRYFFDADTFNPSWLHKKYLYPKGLVEFFWAKLSNQDREKLKQKAAQKHFRAIVSPFHDEDILEPINSLGVKSKDDIVAWLLTHQVNEKTIRYSAFYVDRALRDKQITIKLLVNSILLHIKKSPRRRAIIEIPLTLVHPNWVYFARKRLEPNAVQKNHLYQTTKEL